MNRFTLILATTLATSAVADDTTDTGAPTVQIDPDAITISGISSGGAMAQQLHLAYPDIFSGAGIIAGVPRGCAGGDLATALGSCTAQADGPLPVDRFAAELRADAMAGKAGDTDLLADDRAWLFHGALDTAVAEPVARAAADLYRAFLAEDNIEWVGDVAAAHTFPTVSAGGACDAVAPPFLGACDYDAAGEILNHLYSGLVRPDPAADLALRQWPLPGAAQAGMAGRISVFLPPESTCPDEGCRLHVVLHGCAQSETQVGEQFMTEAGYLEWAASNGIVLAFPQTVVGPTNPLACWDWWGYTGPDYQDRDGRQMRVITDWIDSLSP